MRGGAISASYKNAKKFISIQVKSKATRAESQRRWEKQNLFFGLKTKIKAVALSAPQRLCAITGLIFEL